MAEPGHEHPHFDDDTKACMCERKCCTLAPEICVCPDCSGGCGCTHTEPVASVGFVTKDSGTRQDFGTGSRRDSQDGKGRYDLLPPEAVRRYAQLLERGAAKYGDKNWELGQPFSRVVSSMLRHAFQAAAGQNDEDHLAAVMFNAAALITFQERIAVGTLPADLDDLAA